MVRTLRLTTGEQIIGDAELADGVWTISNPQFLAPNDRGALGMFPLMYICQNKEFQIKDIHVLCHGLPSEQAANEFNTTFGGITTVKGDIASKLILS